MLGRTLRLPPFPAKKVLLVKITNETIMDKLQEAFLLTKRSRHFYFVLGFSCIKTCPGIETLQRYHGYIARSLREFIGIFKDAEED